MSKLLSICIPTFEREDLFKLCIESLERNIATIEKNTEIEVIVSINDSSKYKQSILNQYKILEDYLVVIQNSKNIGGDKNIINCYKKASGKYIWIIGDDDYILDGGIACLIREIKEKNPSCLFINSYGYRKSYNEKPVSNEPSYSCNFNNFIEKISYKSTFISSIVLNSELVDYITAIQFENTSLYQFNLLLQASAHDNNLYIGKYLVAAKINHNYNYDFHDVFVRNYQQQLLLYLDKDVYKKVMVKTILLFYSQYFFHKRLRNIPIDNLIAFDSSLFSFLSYRIIRVIALLPRWAALTYGVIVISFSRIRYGDTILLISKLLLKFKVSSKEKY